MKKNSCRTIFVLLLAALCLSCQNEDMVAPHLTASQTRNAMIGTWKIEKIDYQLCRSGSCTTTKYIGKPQDYFEFRRDSAFLVYNTTATTQNYNNFKADYSLSGAFILTHELWSARYIVKECNPNKVVLVCAYSGSDPYAKFTDTYYLYR